VCVCALFFKFFPNKIPGKMDKYSSSGNLECNFCRILYVQRSILKQKVSTSNYGLWTGINLIELKKKNTRQDKTERERERELER